MPHGGGIAQEANAPGKARGYADVGTVTWRVEPTDGVQAMPVPDGWDRLPWFILEQELSRLQTRLCRASVRGDYPSIRKLQRLLLAGEAARLIAVRRPQIPRGHRHREQPPVAPPPLPPAETWVTTAWYG